MRQTADAKAVKAMNAESLRVRFSLAVGPWRKSMSVNGIMESVMRSTDTLRSKSSFLSLVIVLALLPLLTPSCT